MKSSIAAPSFRNSGIRDDVERLLGFAGDPLLDLIRGADRHRALGDDDLEPVHRLGDAPGRRLDIFKVGVPVGPWGVPTAMNTICDFLTAAAGRW